MSRRTILLGLDGLEPSFADKMMAAGELPALRRLAAESCSFKLDHGPAKRTGLAWEHVSSGLSPDDGKRWSTAHFDPRSYEAWQHATNMVPFAAKIAARTVVFDAPYFDLDITPTTLGLVTWGAHDPGSPECCRPSGLKDEIVERFGAYPATEWIYGFVWPSAERTQRMAAALVEGVNQRSRIAEWLLAERLPEWDLAYVVISELHSATEALWHGVDPSHRLHRAPSSSQAGEGLRDIYRAVDRLVGDLMRRFPDVVLVAFTLHGMGPNESDAASMLLLPELLYRQALGGNHLESCDAWRDPPQALAPSVLHWESAIRSGFRRRMSWWGRLHRRRNPRPAPATREQSGDLGNDPKRSAIDWMPAAWYQPYWHRMSAFALPSFYDGRVRVNLAGRESRGLIKREQYEAFCSGLEALLHECRDWESGEPIVQSIERCGGRDPYALGETEVDIVVLWRRSSLGFVHPRLGTIGPVPQRRTGGHTGPLGVAYIFGGDLPAGEQGVVSSFDVVPTALDLMGIERPAMMSGQSLLQSMARRQAAGAVG